MSKVNEILDFWFEGISDATSFKKDPVPFKKWFTKDKEFDRLIAQRFEEDLVKAKAGQYKDWESDVRGRLALIILFDQFSRNIYRDTANMFAFDPLALPIVLRTIDEGLEKELQLIERVFVYMPLMHAEDLKLQQLCIDSFKQQIKESDEKSPQNTYYYKSNLDYAQKHYEIIKRFERFPHRNDMLKRKSTDEEIAFLKTPGSSF